MSQTEFPPTQQAFMLAFASLLICVGCAAPQGTIQASQNGTNPAIGTFAPPPTSRPQSSNTPLGPVKLHLFVVNVPSRGDRLAGVLGKFVRSDGVDAGTVQRLERNGMRFGVGQMDTWDTITASIEADSQHRAYRPDAYHLPPKLPLYLELDETTATRTVFAIGFDGVLNGSNWADSQAVMEVKQQPDLMDPEAVVFSLTPAVRQRRNRVEVGAWPKPVFEEQAFDEAALTLALAQDQYLAIWPSPDAALPQLIGAALFTRSVEDRRYNTYVFMRFERQLSEASDG